MVALGGGYFLISKVPLYTQIDMARLYLLDGPQNFRWPRIPEGNVTEFESHTTWKLTVLG